MAEPQSKTLLTPRTFYSRDWDEMSGDGLHRYQTLHLSAEETALLKQFLRGAKKVAIRIGIAYDDEDQIAAKYYIFVVDSTKSDEDQFDWPENLPEVL